MKTYFMEWYDKEDEKVATLRINDKQKNLIEFLLEELSLDEILDYSNVAIKITENENQVIDLT